MVIQTLDPHHFIQKAQQIRAHVPTALTQRGLLPKFMSWRLAQDPSTGLVVLFGILNDKYIAEHTQTPFDAYFDPRLLHDLATDLQVQVVPSTHEGLRYAFILDWGQLGQTTAPLDFPGLQPDELLAEETDSHKPLILTRDEQGGVAVLTGSSSPTFAHRVVYHALADGFQQTPMNPTANFPMFQQPLVLPAVVEAEVPRPTALRCATGKPERVHAHCRGKQPGVTARPASGAGRVQRSAEIAVWIGWGVCAGGQLRQNWA